MAKKVKHYSLNDKFDFGKYRGLTLLSVINKDLDYVKWCVGKVDNFELTPEAKQYFDSLVGNISSQNIDYYIMLTDKIKFMAYLMRNAEDAVLEDLSIPVSSFEPRQLELQF